MYLSGATVGSKQSTLPSPGTYEHENGRVINDDNIHRNAEKFSIMSTVTCARANGAVEIECTV